MNLLILESGELGHPLPRGDRRWEHVRRILKKGVGDELAAGIATDSAFAPAPGALGLARIAALDDSGLLLDYEARSEPPQLAPIRLLLGFPRPIQANRIFKDLASLGIAELHLTGTELGEKSYLESDFFRKGEFRRPLLEGAEQAANPRLPLVRTHWSLRRALEALETGEETIDWSRGSRIALHPEAGAPRLGAAIFTAPLTLAVGSERGWTEAELELLKARGYLVASLGDRILKTETATTAAISIVLSRLGRM